MNEVDTLNKFLVASGKDGIVFLKPVPQNISEDDALLLAAYLVTMVMKPARWEEVLKAVQST